VSVAAIPPVGQVAPHLVDPLATASRPASPASFADMIARGVETTTAKLAAADRLVAQAAVDDSIPLHQVTYALEEARISFELMIQLRNRLIDASQQLMNMQL
jgi:flagellar hook-basal body complex protein FliE